jgi:membrane-bound ClpP family serine protease
MIILIFLLFIVGMILIIIEMITPHGISAFVGAGLIIFSCYLAVQRFGVEAGILYSVMAFGLASAISWLVLKNGINFLRLPPPRKSKNPTPPPGPTASTADPAVGDILRVVQPLRPTGTVEWNGRRFAARAINPHEEYGVGEAVVLRDRDSIYLIVERESH